MCLTAELIAVKPALAAGVAHANSKPFLSLYMRRIGFPVFPLIPGLAFCARFFGQSFGWHGSPPSAERHRDKDGTMSTTFYTIHTFTYQ